MPSPLSFQPLLADLKTQIRLAWTDVTQILEAEHADRIAWSQLAAPGLPYAVLLTTRTAPDYDYDQGGTVWHAWHTAFYVGPLTGKATVFQEKGFDLVNQLWLPAGEPSGLTQGMIVTMGDPSWSDESQPNEIFQSANRSQWSVSVPFETLFGQ